MNTSFSTVLRVWGVAVSLFLFTGADWLRFRGPNGSGVSVDQGLPVRWSETENIAWKVDLPGRGVSSPIIIGDRVVLTCCTGFRQDRLHVICFHAKTGEKLWERQLWATGRTMTHPAICTATPTAASDGKRIFAYFSTNDLVCFDLEGNLLWLRGLLNEYPNASNSLGLASSPTVVGETLVVPIENDSQSVTVGLAADTGTTRWKLDRPKLANWASPVVLGDQPGQLPQVVLQSGSRLTVHEPASGRELGVYASGCASQPSSVVGDGVLYVPSGGLTALRFTPGSKEPDLLWQNNRLGASTATPLLYRGKVFTVNGSILKAGDMETGKLLWQLRLKGSFSGSPIASDGRIYLFNESGLGQVIEIGDDRGRRLKGGELGEKILSSPSMAGGALYIRSDAHLWKISSTATGG